MHRKILPLIALLAATTLTPAAASDPIEIFPLSSTFDDYIPPAAIEIAGLTLETHLLGLGSDKATGGSNVQKWTDYAFIINEYDRNGDILRQSLCEQPGVVGMADEDDETICFYAPVLEEVIGALEPEDIEGIQMDYAGIIEEIGAEDQYAARAGGGGGLDEEDAQDEDEEDGRLLRQTVGLRFGPVLGRFDFGLRVLGENGATSDAVNIMSGDWSCDDSSLDDPTEMEFCIWSPSDPNDRMVVLPTSPQGRS